MPPRCPRCLFPPDLCLCPAIPRIAVPYRFVVLRHASELPRLTNTARWAALALSGAEVRDHALADRPLETDDLGAPGTFLLFPSPHPPAAPSPPPRTIVVPDGTWAQARRMVQRIPALRELPRLSLPAPPEMVRLRRPPRAGGMSTLEAIAAALTLLGEREAAARLRALHALGVERVLRLKGTPLAAAG